MVKHTHTNKLALINAHILAGFGGEDALDSPAGTDGLNSVGMITGMMEVRIQQGRGGSGKEEGERKQEGMIRAA